MKMLTAIIRPERLDDVVEALEAIGIDKLTVTEVAGVGLPGAPYFLAAILMATTTVMVVRSATTLRSPAAARPS